MDFSQKCTTLHLQFSSTSKCETTKHLAPFYSCKSTEAADFCASCHPVRCPHGEMNLFNYSLPNQTVVVPLLLQRYSTV